MAQLEISLYKKIADYYNSLYNSLSAVTQPAQNALYAIVDITTNYGDPSGDAAAALAVELALLVPFNLAYAGSQNIVNSIAPILDAVKAINNYVVNNSGEAVSVTAKVKLDNFVNSVSWDGASVPSGWESLSILAGYNTDDWN